MLEMEILKSEDVNIYRSSVQLFSDATSFRR
jgi:hypothetical protein